MIKINEKLIIQEFKKIKEKGWIKSIRRGPTGVGATFEKELRLKENQMTFPDFFGIEIKTKRNKMNYYTTLFNCNPKGKHQFEINYLTEKFGYPDKIMNKINILNHSTLANKKTNLGNKYKTQIFVNRDTRTINLLIYTRNDILIDSNFYWSFKELKERLLNKCTYIAFIGADRKYIQKHEYFRYTNIAVYKLKNFETFIEYIEKGYIRITFKVGVFRNGIRKGQLHNHGTGFEIIEKDLDKIYTKSY